MILPPIHVRVDVDTRHQLGVHVMIVVYSGTIVVPINVLSVVVLARIKYYANFIPVICMLCTHNPHFIKYRPMRQGSAPCS